MPATKTKSPALAPRLHVPSALMAPGGLSVLTPFGEGACAKLTLDAMAIAAMQAKTSRGNIWALHAEKATCIDVRFWGVDGQVGPDDQRYVVDRIVAHEGVVAGHLAAVKIQIVEPKRHLSDPIPVFLAERLAWILRFRAVEPSALIVGIENFAADQLQHPGGEI